MLKKLIAYSVSMMLIFAGSETVKAEDVLIESNSKPTDILVDGFTVSDDTLFDEFSKEEEPEIETTEEEPEEIVVTTPYIPEPEPEEPDLEKRYSKQGLLKVQITCYVEAGKPTCTGSYKMDGVAAGCKEWLGRVGCLYKVNEDGTLGEYLDTVEFNDIGYGAPIGMGTKSDLLKGKSAGTIETGKTIDIRRPNNSECKTYMKTTYTGGGTTGSEVYLQLIDGNG